AATQVDTTAPRSRARGRPPTRFGGSSVTRPHYAPPRARRVAERPTLDRAAIVAHSQSWPARAPLAAHAAQPRDSTDRRRLETMLREFPQRYRPRLVFLRSRFCAVRVFPHACRDLLAPCFHRRPSIARSRVDLPATPQAASRVSFVARRRYEIPKNPTSREMC